ncbi:MAG: phosphatase PAP2 family protein [Solirubrobacteraceae bacterium]
MRRSPSLRLLIGVAIAASAVFVALTVAVTTNPSVGIDSRAFDLANDLREPWLDHVVRVITTLGLIVVVGPAVLLAAVLLLRHQHRARATALVSGAALAWVTVWITKRVVDRPRPPGPLVHTGGQSYPSAHAANSVGWFALALAVTVLIPRRGIRTAAVAAGALLALLVGLSRIYLRAHYATDVLGGEALAISMYSLTAIAVLGWRSRRASAGVPSPSAHAGQ